MSDIFELSLNIPIQIPVKISSANGSPGYSDRHAKEDHSHQLPIFPKCSLFRGTSQTIAPSTPTEVWYNDVIDYDIGPMSNSGVIFIAEAGLYMFSAFLYVAAVPGNTLVELYISNQGGGRMGWHKMFIPTGGFDGCLNASGQGRCAAGDRIVCSCFQQSGANITVFGGQQCRFMGAKISD